MVRKKLKSVTLGFTLIELLAVIVILAIIALIAVPIVLNIINDAKEESEKRSIANYAKSFDKYIATKNMKQPGQSYDLLYNYKDDINYSGDRITCDFSETSNTDREFSTLIDGKLTLRWCHVGNDSKYYKYEDGEIEEMHEYKTYAVGDTIELEGQLYHVIVPSSSRVDYVTILKDIPLTTNEVDNYGGVGTPNNRVNKYKSYPARGYSYNYYNNYGGALYYNTDKCGEVNGQCIKTECTADYNKSNIKYIVDNWETAIFRNKELVNINGYTSRLIKVEELQKYLGYENLKSGSNVVPDWVKGDHYYYYTMSPIDEIVSDEIWYVSQGSSLGEGGVTCIFNPGVIRPVVNVFKDKIVEE